MAQCCSVTPSFVAQSDLQNIPSFEPNSDRNTSKRRFRSRPRKNSKNNGSSSDSSALMFKTLKFTAAPVSRVLQSAIPAEKSPESVLPSPPFTSEPFTFATCLPLNPAPVGPGYSMATHIALTLHGETFSYNLQLLDSDPEVIIELLKTTASERGVWMMVGAYYRRLGNPTSAIKVMTTMLEGKPVPYLVRHCFLTSRPFSHGSVSDPRDRSEACVPSSIRLRN